MMAKKKPIVGEQAREYPAPGLTGNRFQEYPLDESDQHHADNARFEPLKLDPEDDANAIAHVTNLSGMETLGRIIGEHPDVSAFASKGRHIAPQEMHLLKSDLKDYGASSPAVDRLRAAADDADKTGRSLIIVKDHELIPPEERASVLHEELDHAWQRAETGESLTEHLRASAKPLIQSRLGKQAMSALETDQEYKFRSNGEAAAEIGVRLMRPGRYTELGLSHDQAGVLGQQYVQAWSKEYGIASANRISQRIFEALKSSR
jgi:hypothetical protein